MSKACKTGHFWIFSY